MIESTKFLEVIFLENLIYFFSGVFVFAAAYVLFSRTASRDKDRGRARQPYAGADYYNEKTGLFKPISQKKEE